MILVGRTQLINVADRHCPYSGVQISAAMLLSDEVEIEHILPFSQTLDDSLNNKTVACAKPIASRATARLGMHSGCKAQQAWNTKTSSPGQNKCPKENAIALPKMATNAG